MQLIFIYILILIHTGNFNCYIKAVPDEVLLLICSYLQEKELCRMAQTCTRLNSICQDGCLWFVVNELNFILHYIDKYGWLWNVQSFPLDRNKGVGFPFAMLLQKISYGFKRGQAKRISWCKGYSIPSRDSSFQKIVKIPDYYFICLVQKKTVIQHLEA